MKAVTHLEKVIAGETSAVTHLEKVISQETAAVTYTEKVIAGEAPPITHLQKVIAGEARPVTHLEYVWAGGSPPSVQEYTGAVPVTFVADGTPLLDYIISGNTVQNGTPTPDIPIMPQGTGERTGNLFTGQYSQFDNTGGTGTTYAYFKIDEDFTLSFKARNNLTVPQGYYVGISANGGNNSSGVTWALGSNNTISAGNVRTVKSSTNDYHCFSFYPKNETVFNWLVENFEIILNTGSTPLPYEPYGYKIPISSANTTTPVYLGEVQSTRRIKKLVLSSSQNWKLQSINSHGIANFYITVVNDFLDIASVISNFFTRQTTAIAGTTTEGMLIALSAATATIYIRINSQTASTAQGFKDWLDSLSDEVDIWYVLAEPETSIVNEPLMKIGEYTDTLSMEQAGVQIPTANGSTTLDVETTVPPSEVYIKYKGV